MPIDSLNGYGGVFRNTCNSSVPGNANTYQYARTGNGYILATFFDYHSTYGPRGYLKNRLKQNLKPGKTYCVKFHVNIANTSPRGMNGFSAFLGADVPLSFMLPQINNPYGQVISDTLNWVPVTGTFVADGTEKFMVIGNFLTDEQVLTLSIYTPYFPQNWTDACIDDVSCIEVDLPAYAGPDASIVPGDSAFIGRKPDFAIDPGCTWFQLPGMTPIDTISGMWVKPVTTTTYVVRQELDCSAVKRDTVVVFMNLAGDEEFKRSSDDFKIFPVPASNSLNLACSFIENNETVSVTIVNHLGKIVLEEKVVFTGEEARVDIHELTAGIYFLLIKNSNRGSFSRRFVVAR